MAEITLKAATLTRPWTAAVKDGSVSPGRFALEFEEVPVIIRAFRRMVRSLDFDVTEMAFTTYLCARSSGKPFTALPVFLVRGFHHGAIVRPAAAGPVESAGAVPQALEGQRVGVNRGYTVTTGVWARGILADQYGVDLSRVTWVPSGDEHVAEYQPPANVQPAGADEDVPAQVAGGELAAGVGFARDAFAASGPGVVPLLPDAEQAGYDALRDRGYYPINHLLVVKDELLAANPDLAPALFAAYAEAKNQYVA
jgi:4,5-dihydroxyphthalate decarboxylase